MPLLIEGIAARLQMRRGSLVIDFGVQQAALEVLARGLGGCPENLAVGPAPSVHLALQSERLRDVGLRNEMTSMSVIFMG